MQRDQFALFRDAQGRFQCVRSEAVDLVFTLHQSIFAGSPKIESTWGTAHVEKQDLIVTLDCGKLRADPPATDLAVTVEGPPKAGWAPEWRSWSAGTDEREQDLGRTLQLDTFLDKVWLRPDLLRMTSPPLLKGHAR